MAISTLSINGNVLNIKDYATIEYVNNRILDTYPVGSIYISLNNTDPSELFGGTWKRLQDGRCLIQANSTFQAGETGGNTSYTLQQQNLPDRTCVFLLNDTGKQLQGYAIVKPQSDNTVQSDGKNWFYCNLIDANKYGKQVSYKQPFSLMQPYLAVYMFQRIS